MQLYFAPMQGLTTAAYRNIHRRMFPGIDRYYTPFLSANRTLAFKRKELRDVLPENNEGMPLVPQVLGNKGEEVAWAVRSLYEVGYREINLNLGCSMPQVAGRRKGAGMLGDLPALDRFFEETFEAMRDLPGLCFTVKTRAGDRDTGQARELMGIYNRYPIGEVIVHPRVRADVYENVPDLEAFQAMYEESVHLISYNGDIYTAQDYRRIAERFPDLRAVMIGRGLVRNPALVRVIGGGEGMRLSELRELHRALWRAYLEAFPDERHAVAKMKGWWHYQGWLFPEMARPLKKINKAGRRMEYEAAAEAFFATLELERGKDACYL